VRVEKETDMSDFIKGPWIAFRSNPSDGVDGWWLSSQPSPILRGFTKEICWINGSDENEPYAHLIAAAPDMYAALKAVQNYLSSDCEGDDERAAAMIDASIAKAEGK